MYIVPILLVANAFLGIYYNLSVWYKLTQKTQWAVYIAMVGAGITLLVNIIGIPLYGMMASVYATLLCYGVMMLLSYYFGQKFYPIPYQVKSLLIYLFLGTGLIVLFTYLPIKEWNIILQYSIKFVFVGVYIGIFLSQSKIAIRKSTLRK